MRLPWWSLVSGFAATRDLAGLQGGAIEVHKALTEQTMAANGALPPGAMPAKDSRQVRLTISCFCMLRRGQKCAHISYVVHACLEALLPSWLPCRVVQKQL